jgi:hypothetical protein
VADALTLKEVFTKFEAKPSRSVSRHVRTNKEGVEKDHKPSDTIAKDQDSAAKGGPGSFVTLSVAEGNIVKPLPFPRKCGIGKNPPLPPQAKVVASFLFQERIGLFAGRTRRETETTSAPTRCHSKLEPRQPPVKAKVICII